MTLIIGLFTATILAFVNNWISARSGIDENLRTQRLRLYPALWALTSAVPRWPRADPAHAALNDLHRNLRAWYYSEGGMFLSKIARDRYGQFQELIAAILKALPEERSLSTRTYDDLVETASALRTALTEDLDTRRKKSLLETWRRARWHKRAAKAASKRIERYGRIEICES